jgi:hypothetical protein
MRIAFDRFGARVHRNDLLVEQDAGGRPQALVGQGDAFAQKRAP